MKISATFWLLALLLFSFLALSRSHWWVCLQFFGGAGRLLAGLFYLSTRYMSQVFTLGANIMCSSNIAGLVNLQRQICRENPDVMVSIGKGAKLGVEECQQQMKDQKWNCSTMARDVTVFGRIMRKASLESAFVYAITSAGVVHEVTRACSRGELRDCDCDTNHKGAAAEGFDWGGCSDNIAYGLKIAKLFVDSVEQERDARAKMNLHNNFVGRRAVQSHTILRCKCHGISASCEYKTCWKVMVPFKVVGSYLRHKYHNGVLVTVDQSGSELVMADPGYPIKPPRDDLVFLEDSPDYCALNTNTGSLGTAGRVCNATSPGHHGSCEFLCCGRGFNTIQIVEEYQCSCKFQWCCYVNCTTCTRTYDKHFCKSPEEKERSASKDSGSQQPSVANTGTDLNEQNKIPKNTGK